MKIEKHFTKISLLETCIDFFLLIILLNVASFTITVLEGEPRVLLFDLSWIFQFVLPFIYVVIHNIYHSESLLKVKSQNTPNVFLTEKPDIIIHEEYNTATNTNSKKSENIVKTPLTVDILLKEEAEI